MALVAALVKTQGPRGLTNEVLTKHPALIVGDTLIDRGHGLEFPADWANKGMPPELILEELRPLLELPVELVLPTHGAPTDRAALERALS